TCVYCSCAARARRSCPTRRSSDLRGVTTEPDPSGWPAGSGLAAQARDLVERDAGRDGGVEGLGVRADGDGGDDVARLAHEAGQRSEEHTSELQSRENLVCRLLLEK